MRKFSTLALTLAVILGIANPASAAIYNEQYAYDTNDGPGYIYSGANIDYMAVYEDSNFPGDLSILVFFKGWVSRSNFMGSDYGHVNIDVDGDLKEDFLIQASKSYYPDNRQPIAANLVDTKRLQTVPNCNAQTWVGGGFSSTNDNFVGFAFSKDCLPMGSTVNIMFASSIIGYFDWTGYFTFDTGITPQTSANYGIPSARANNSFLTTNPADSPEDIVSLAPRLAESVVVVNCANGTGSGWVAETDLSTAQLGQGFKSTVITNHHVVEDCIRAGSVDIVTKDGTKLVGTIYATDPENDLAGVFVKTALPALDWQGETPAQGWWIGVLGSPTGLLSGYLTTGLIGGITNGRVLVTAPIRPGNSGGPVFDRDGRVLGVATAYLDGFENINIAGGAHLLCQAVVKCQSSADVWSDNLTASPENQKESSSSETVSGMKVQRAGSQLFITSPDLQGDFEVYEDGDLLDTFTFNGMRQAHVIERRVTGAIQIWLIKDGATSRVNYEFTKDLLWFQNVNLGSVSEARLGSDAAEKVARLVRHQYLNEGAWLDRPSKVTKFICTGIYREQATPAEKLSARKRAKTACESAESKQPTGGSISFFFQTKSTKSATYVGKVLVTVKGVESFVESRLTQ